MNFKYLSSLSVIVLLNTSTASFANSNCYSIQNRDQQNYCLAISKSNKSNCYSIQNRDLQNFCLAQVGGNKSNCYSIENRDYQNQCLAMF